MQTKHRKYHEIFQDFRRDFSQPHTSGARASYHCMMFRLVINLPRRIVSDVLLWISCSVSLLCRSGVSLVCMFPGKPAVSSPSRTATTVRAVPSVLPSLSTGVAPSVGETSETVLKFVTEAEEISCHEKYINDPTKNMLENLREHRECTASNYEACRCLL